MKRIVVIALSLLVFVGAGFGIKNWLSALEGSKEVNVQ